MHAYHEILSATCAVYVLSIVGVVAVVAFVAKSRIIFLAGSLGSLLGYFLPEGGIYPNGTAEAIFMVHLEFSADHVFWHGVFGAVVATVITALVLQRLRTTPISN
jgi:hypothetical protein